MGREREPTAAERIRASGYEEAEVCRVACYHPTAFARGMAGDRNALLADFAARADRALAALDEAVRAGEAAAALAREQVLDRHRKREYYDRLVTTRTAPAAG